MARITVEDCLEKVDNQYDLVLLAKERTVQLNAGAPMLVEEDNDKRTIISLREIGDGKIDVKEVEANAIKRLRKEPDESEEQEESEESDDIAVSPIGIPLIAGPGAITAAMLLSSQTPQLYSYFTLIFSIFFVLSLVYLILRNGNVILKLLGTTGIRIIQRLMGLILMVIAVQFVINGVISIYNPLMG